MKTLTERIFGDTEERKKKEARDKFQIQEFDGKLFLTCDNTLVCPMGMFNLNPIDALLMIRDLYVKRNLPTT